jgi:hypothetical protein
MEPILPLLLPVHFCSRFAPLPGTGFDKKTNQKNQGCQRVLRLSIKEVKHCSDGLYLGISHLPLHILLDLEPRLNVPNFPIIAS